jgi:hypothetical protein
MGKSRAKVARNSRLAAREKFFGISAGILPGEGRPPSLSRDTGAFAWRRRRFVHAHRARLGAPRALEARSMPETSQVGVETLMSIQGPDHASATRPPLPSAAAAARPSDSVAVRSRDQGGRDAALGQRSERGVPRAVGRWSAQGPRHEPRRVTWEAARLGSPRLRLSRRRDRGHDHGSVRLYAGASHRDIPTCQKGRREAQYVNKPTQWLLKGVQSK